MRQKANIRDFTPAKARSLTMEKPHIATGTPAPLLEWLAKILRRMAHEARPGDQEQPDITG